MAKDIFHEALGEFINYRRVLKKTDPNRTLFLAVPVDAYQTFFVAPFAQEAIEEENLLMIIFDPAKKRGSLTIFAKSNFRLFQCGFSPLFSNKLQQWAKATLG